MLCGCSQKSVCSHTKLLTFQDYGANNTNTEIPTAVARIEMMAPHVSANQPTNQPALIYECITSYLPYTTCLHVYDLTVRAGGVWVRDCDSTFISATKTEYFLYKFWTISSHVCGYCWWGVRNFSSEVCGNKHWIFLVWGQDSFQLSLWVWTLDFLMGSRDISRHVCDDKKQII